MNDDRSQPTTAEAVPASGSPAMKPSRRRTLRSFAAAMLVGAALAGAVWLLVVPRLRPHVFSGAVIQSSNPAPGIDLAASGGGSLSLEDLQGKVVVIYFGYTYCPDVCPATLSKLDRALDDLGPASEDVQVVMVSVDPERDTPAALADYLGHFDSSFIGLTGPVDEVAAVATVYGVYFEAREGSSQTGYLVDHTASLMVVDRAGFLKLVVPPDATSAQIAADLDYLL